jgi:SAM-dependent methyltransferase
MIRRSNPARNADQPRCLNIGCGRRYHPAWTNLDLEVSDPSIIRHDVTRGIPFEEEQFDAVYHSHILEHLKPEQGRQLVAECNRVLKPGGLLRIVVPDLERIAKLYLQTHQQAWSGDEASSIDYNWMKLELLDQLVREKSGGRMGKYMANRKIRNSEFVHSRVGVEYSVCQQPLVTDARKRSLTERAAELTFGFRKRMARRFVRWMMGRNAESAFDEGLFRSQGEIHRWMYDRYSLRDLCQNAGFVNFRVCQADESQIDGFATFELDAVNGQVCKPDSIFIECEKPRTGSSVKAA